MDNLAFKYNRFLITVFAFAPFVAWFTLSYLEMDFKRVIQLFSFIGVFFLLLFKKKTQSFRFPKYLLFYLIFIFYVFYSDFIKLGRTFEIKYLFASSLIGGFNFMLIIENISIPKKYYSFILRVSSIVLLIAFFVIIIQQAIDPGFFIRSDLGALSIATEVGENQNRLLSIYSWAGGLLAVGFGFVPIFILIVENLYLKKKNIFIWIIMGLTFALLSKARWIMLNTLLVFFLLVINHKNKNQQLFKILFFVPVFFIGSIFLLESVGIDAKGIVNERILENDKRYLYQKTASTRLLAFEAFNKFYWDHPFFGKGDIKYGMGAKNNQDYLLSKFLRGRSSQIHVGYLSLLYLYGLVGASLFLSFLFLLLKRLYKDAKVTKVWAPFLAFLGFAVANLTLVTFEFYHVGFIIVLVAHRYHNQEMVLKNEL